MDSWIGLLCVVLVGYLADSGGLMVIEPKLQEDIIGSENCHFTKWESLHIYPTDQEHSTIMWGDRITVSEEETNRPHA